MQSRDVRVPVHFDAQMSSDQGRGLALIVNASSRGLALRSDQAPPRGAYVELRAGDEVIVARVVWSKDEFFGVRTRCPIPAGMRPQAALNRVGAMGALHVAVNNATPAAAQMLEQSLTRARNLQFFFIVVLGLCSAALGYLSMREALGGPLDAARIALSRSI